MVRPFFHVFQRLGRTIQAKRIPLTPAGIGLSVFCNEVGQSDREKNVWKKGLAAGPFSVIGNVTASAPETLLFVH
jgi:hypothetical protein